MSTRRRVPGRPPAAYLRVRAVATCAPGQPLTVGDVAELRGPPGSVVRAGAAPLGCAPGPGRHLVVSVLDVLAAVRRAAPGADWRVIGARDALVEGRADRRPRWWLGVAAWVLLCIGAATTLLNFHADVNMPAAHRELYRLATGRGSAHPFAVEVPYAVGVGLGALLFLVGPRHPGGDPGPLELEAARYRQRLRAYWRGRGRRG